jgi:hypothetical protein
MWRSHSWLPSGNRVKTNMNEPLKMLPAGTVIECRNYDASNEIHEIPKDCYIRIDGYSGDYEINIISKVEIPNPNYEAELVRYNELLEIKKGIERERRKKNLANKKLQEQKEREEYERLKKKYG